MVQVAHLLNVSHARVRQWVHGRVELPEPFPTADETYNKANGDLVPWWRVERKSELLDWRRRNQAWIAENFLSRGHANAGVPRVRDAADIARTFFVDSPVPALEALAVLADTADTGCVLTDEQSAVAEKALELVTLMSDYVPEDDTANDHLYEILRNVTQAGHARTISNGGATNQLAFLLERLGFDSLVEHLARTPQPHAVEER